MLAKSIEDNNYTKMNKSVTKLRMLNFRRLAVFGLLLFGAFALRAQNSADLQISPVVYCEGQMGSYTVNLTGYDPNDVEWYEWDFGNSTVIKRDSTFGKPVNNSINQTLPAGYYNIKMTVRFKAGKYPDVVKSYLDTVYRLPVTKFQLSPATPDSQCFKGNRYCFDNLSTQNGQPSNAIANYYWVFGDGNIYNTTDTNDRATCNQYALGNRFFNVSLRVTDQLGCKTSDADPNGKANVFVAKDLGPGFSLTGTPRCDTTPYIFTNTSLTPYSEVKWFVWHFGDGTSYYSKYPQAQGTKDDSMYRRPFTHKYVIEGVFKPKLVIAHKYFNCIDTFDYEKTGMQLPENIKIKINILTRRSMSNDSLADSVCYKDFGSGAVCLFNEYPLEGPGGTRVGILWDFADPNANPPGSDKFLNQLTPCYKYQDMGQFFPTLTVTCPGTPPRTYNFWSRIDSVLDSNFIYKWYPFHNANTYNLAPNFYYQENYPPIPNPRINTLNGYVFQNTDSLNYGQYTIGYAYDTLYHPTTNDIERVYMNIVHSDSITNHYKYFNYTQGTYIDSSQTVLVPPSGSYKIYKEMLNNPTRYTKAGLWGYGVQIMGPEVTIENGGPYESPPDPRNHPPITIPQFMKNQCGPTYPVEFVNASKAYLSDHLYIKWDFGDRDFAPTCTSFSVPNYATYNFGEPPYISASDMVNRTEGRFIANGNTYIGRVLNCNFSHDTLPIHAYQEWDKVFLWYKYGHDFPKWDTSSTNGWTRDPSKVTWDGTNGVKLVREWDTLAWNKPLVAGGSVPTRMDTMTGIWPTDMNPNRPITINNNIPDPFAQAKGYWNIILEPGFRVDSASYLTRNGAPGAFPSPLPDGTQRRYRGSDIIPNSNPPRTFYRYVFDWVVQKCMTVELTEYDSVNHKSQDPGFPGDELIIDALDCHGTSSVQLPLSKPDAYGLGFDGKICPGFAAQGGGTPTFTFNASGFMDLDHQVGSPGTLPRCGRTLLWINQDSLLDRYDGTPCALDAFTDFSGTSPMNNTTTTPGGLNMPPLFNGANWNPLTMWTSPGGNRAIAQYVPSPPGLPYANMPYDPKGYVTVGLVIGNGCASPTNCGLPGCITDTVWYHNFFHFIQLDPNFTIWRYEPPPAPGMPATSLPPYCYLRGKGDMTVSYFDSTQDFIEADVWAWGDGLLTIDSFYYFKDSAQIGRDFYTYKDVVDPGYRKLSPTDTVLHRFYTNYKTHFVYTFEQPGTVKSVIDTFVTIVDSSYYEISKQKFRNDTYRTASPVTYTNDYTDPELPIFRLRFLCSDATQPFTVLKVETYQLGKDVKIDTTINTIWQCYDQLHVLPPLRIDTFIKKIDKAMELLPVTHDYQLTSWQQTVPGGVPGTRDRRNDITPVLHVMMTTTECDQRALRYVVIGVIDTFDINDTIFCLGETAYFTDSVRYWFPFGCSRPLLPGMDVYDLFDYWDEAYTHPDDSIYWVVDATDPLNAEDLGRQRIHPVTGQVEKAFYHERMYWDFESDGVIDFSGTNPTHKFMAPGRYAVSMITRDSLGYWDTCIRHVNVVQPLAKILSKDVFSCMDTVKFRGDSSVVIDQCFINSGGTVSCDYITNRKWWFGDFGYGPEAYRSILINPTYDYRKNGKYKIQLVIQTAQGCIDTARKEIFISGPRPKIVLLDDTLGCVPYKVRILSIPDRDLTPLDTPTKLTVVQSLGSDKVQIPIPNSVIDTVVFTYNNPGTYYVTAQGIDNYIPGNANCPIITVPDTFEGAEPPIRIHVRSPYPVEVATSKQRVCIGEVFKVLNRSPLDTITRFRLDVYDSAYTTRIDTNLKTNFVLDTSFKYRLMAPGTFQFVLNSTRFMRNMPPCPWSDTTTVNVVKVDANFDTIPTAPPKWLFKNTSDTAMAYMYVWSLYNPDGTLRKSITYDKANYPPHFDFGEDFGNDTGTFKVCLLAISDPLAGCRDSLCKFVDNHFVTGIDIPNVMTPNGDNKNDEFKIVAIGIEKYDLTIWNRWGGKVYESTDAKKLWNGKVNNDGAECPAGTYYYIFTYRLRGQTAESTVRGTITLLRD